MSQSLKSRLDDDVKAAMRAREKERLGVLRLVMAAIKQREVDERIALDDAAVLGVLTSMIKSRRDSIDQYQKANRQDLADVESYEISVIEDYMPQALSADELATLIDEAITGAGASSMKEMGKVMNALRPQVLGRTDMGALSGLVKAKLGG
ncbi:MAG: GatB/YqeY domain-containing protein [Pseudomonadota bacterium]